MRFSNDQSRASARHIAGPGTWPQVTPADGEQLSRVRSPDGGIYADASPDRIATAFTRRNRRDSPGIGKRILRIGHAGTMLGRAVTSVGLGSLGATNFSFGADGRKPSRFAAARVHGQ